MKKILILIVLLALSTQSFASIITACKNTTRNYSANIICNKFVKNAKIAKACGRATNDPSAQKVCFKRVKDYQVAKACGMVNYAINLNSVNKENFTSF